MREQLPEHSPYLMEHSPYVMEEEKPPRWRMFAYYVIVVGAFVFCYLVSLDMPANSQPWYCQYRDCSPRSYGYEMPRGNGTSPGHWGSQGWYSREPRNPYYGYRLGPSRSYGGMGYRNRYGDPY
jgi:hypothetical protein